MRMVRKLSLEDRPRKFRGPAAVKHNGHIGTGPKPGPKRAVNVSVDAEILKAAKAMNVNVSQALEDVLRKITEPERIRHFREEHKESLASYDRLIERAGVFGEELLDLDDPSV